MSNSQIKILSFFLLSLIYVSDLRSQISATFDTTFNYACNGIPCDYDGPSILINEIMVSPTVGDGSISGQVHPTLGQGLAEWIELYNPDLCEPVDISCYYLGNYTFEGTGGFLLPEGTVVPPSGFALIRGVNAAPVPAQRLVQNGGNVVEVVVPENIGDEGVCGSGSRVWFPNAGGWFAFYDRDGVAQDAVRWGSGNTGDMSGTPCTSVGYGCNSPGQTLASYSNIPDNRKTHASTIDAGNHKGESIRRISDGGDWDGPGSPTYANCNDDCIPPGESTCNGSATVTPSGGTPPYTYQWDDPEQQMTATAEDLCAGIYTVEVTDANDVSQEFEIEIHDYVPNVEFNAGQTVCLNETPFQLDDFSPSATQNDVVTFGGSGMNNDVFVPSDAGEGTHEITFTFEDEFECTNSATDEITVLGLPNVEISNNNSPYCVVETDAELVLSPVGGTLFGNGVQSNIFNPSEAGPGIHEVYYVYTDGNGCSDTAFVDVNVVGLPTIAMNNPSQICLNEPAFELQAMPSGGSFEINGVVSIEFNPLELGVGEHEVYYEVVDENGCYNNKTVNTEVLPIPTVEFDPEFQDGCPPVEATFSAESSPVKNCLWDFGDGNTSDKCGFVTHEYSTSGCYDVSIQVEDFRGCKSKASAEEIVCVFPEPNANFAFSPDTVSEFFTDVNFTNLSTDGWDYEWSIENAYPDWSEEVHPSVEYPEGEVGEYPVTLYVTSEFGCTDQITKFVPIVSDVIIYVPNSFTPDNDKHNEIWKPVIEGIDIYDFHLEVFNRWGELIWESKNPDVGWDGFYRNKKVKSGTYVWRIEARDNHTSERYEWMGHVNVLY